LVQTIQLIACAVNFLITWIPNAGFPSIIQLTYKVKMMLLCQVPALASLVGLLFLLLFLDWCSCLRIGIKMVLSIPMTTSTAMASVATSLKAASTTSSASRMCTFASSLVAGSTGAVEALAPSVTSPWILQISSLDGGTNTVFLNQPMLHS
jgi:hypothetical protein